MDGTLALVTGSALHNNNLSPRTTVADNNTSVSPWDTSAPSSFTRDPRFAALKSGKSYSQTGTESVARRTRATGKNPGTIASMTKDPAGRHTGAYSRKKAGA